MFKKLTLLAMALGALVALAAPAFASANVQLTDVNGNRIPNGSEITVTSGNLVTTTESGFLECAEAEAGKVTIHFEVVTNGLEHVVLKQLGAATTVNCVLNIGTAKIPTTITDGTVGVEENEEEEITHEVTINTWGTGVTNSTFVSDIPVGGGAEISCHLEGAVHLQGSNGSDVLNAGPSLLAGAGAGCPNAGVIEGSFTIENAAGSVTLDSVNTP